MSDEKTKRRSGIGSIKPPTYASFGNENGDEEEGSKTAVQTPEPSEVQTARSPEIQQSSSPGSEASSMPAVQTVKSSNVKKSKHPDWKQQTVYFRLISLSG